MLSELNNCRLCPRRCGINRNRGQYGFCGAGSEIKIARAALHFWEEPCVSGKSGSGTVFFSNCTMKCIFCQNYKISTDNMGYNVSVEELSDIFLKLQNQGANNINLVTPTHYVPQIIKALDMAKAKGMNLPILYNTGGYETVDTIKMLDGYVDIYMPDFKYWDNKLAESYSAAGNYRECCVDAMVEMYKQVGKIRLNENGIMQRGMIVRHLMLPGSLIDTVKIINYMHKVYGDNVYFSLMSQYTPVRSIEKYKKLNNTLERRAYDAAVTLCERLDMTNVFVQDGEAAKESFIPEFNGKK